MKVIVVSAPITVVIIRILSSRHSQIVHVEIPDAAPVRIGNSVLIEIVAVVGIRLAAKVPIRLELTNVDA